MESGKKFERTLVALAVPLSLVAGMRVPAYAEEATALDGNDTIVVVADGDGDNAAKEDSIVVADDSAQESAAEAATVSANKADGVAEGVQESDDNCGVLYLDPHKGPA